MTNTTRTCRIFLVWNPRRRGAYAAMERLRLRLVDETLTMLAIRRRVYDPNAPVAIEDEPTAPLRRPAVTQVAAPAG